MRVLFFQRDAIALWPDHLAGELEMQPSAVIADTLRRRVEHLFDMSNRFMRAECAKYGIVLPPEEPEQPGTRLAYYEQYVRDSKTGKVEVVAWEAQTGTQPWLDKHPSVAGDVQKLCRIVRAKKEWTAEMGRVARAPRRMETCR